MGVNAHFDAPVMRTDRPAYPPARQRLAASPSGRPWRRSRLGRGGEPPQGHRCPVRARGRARFHTLVPAPSRGRSPKNYPCGKATIYAVAVFGRRNWPATGGGRRYPADRPDRGCGAVMVGRMWHAGAVVVLGVAGLPLIVWALRLGGASGRGRRPGVDRAR